MPPEAPGNLVAVDMKLKQGERVISKDSDWITVSWYAQTPPPGSLTVGKGVAFVYDKKHVRCQPIPDPDIKEDSNGFYWRDTAHGLGLMFILILPEGYTIRDPSPWPVEAKSFEDRIALYWMPAGGEGTRVKISWNLELFGQTLDNEVLRLNDLISKAENVPQNDGVEFPQEPEDLSEYLHKLLVTHFNEEELKTLCFYLKIDFDELGGGNKSGKARELLLYLERHERISDLIQKGKQIRPNRISWPKAK